MELMKLPDKYTSERLESACNWALEYTKSVIISKNPINKSCPQAICTEITIFVKGADLHSEGADLPFK